MPCDYSKYPKNWKQIRERILLRAGHKCEWCGVPDRWLRVGDKVVNPGSSEAFYAGEEYAAGTGPKPRQIVLTIAHIDNPNPMDCRDENLAALCQRCHNRHDNPMRQANARRTRLARNVLAPLFEGET